MLKMIFSQLFIFLVCGKLVANENSVDQQYAAIKSATSRYIDFINLLGREKGFDAATSLICSSDCKKIFNGQLQAHNRDEFVSQLLSIKEKQGNFVINPLDIVISTQDRAAAIRLIIAIEKAGVFTAVVLLRYTPDLLVEEINEVFNEFKGAVNEIPKIR